MSAIESITIVWIILPAIALAIVCAARLVRRRRNRKVGTWLNRYRINCGWMS